MTLLHLSGARILLWAHDRSGEPFEVSKVVSHPVQPKCPSAPRCPEDVIADGLFAGSSNPTWVDPTERPAGHCPYAFEVRGECLQHRNQVALERALFRPSEIELTRRVLQAVGYDVVEESVDPTREPARILKAHGHVGSQHQVRLLRSPSAGAIVLVRQVRTARRSRRLRVLPVGGRR